MGEPKSTLQSKTSRTQQQRITVGPNAMRAASAGAGDNISFLMKGKNIDELSFISHKNRPTIRRGGDKYEILSISNDEGVITIDGIKVAPSYEHKLVSMAIDNTWRKASISHVQDIVQREIDRLSRSGYLD